MEERRNKKEENEPCGILTAAGAPLLFLLLAEREVKAEDDFDLSFLSFPFLSSKKKKNNENEVKRTEQK